MSIPFVDFNPQYQIIKDTIYKGLHEVFERGDFILGQATQDFEVQFASYCEASYAIGVNSGTDALYLALAALDVGPGDEVILPSFTFIATALCISYTGATPVFVDVEAQTCNMDPDCVEAAITGKTRAIIPVHLYGQTANMDEIKALAQAKGIAVAEDAAQAHGASYKGKRVGALGDIACFSFYPTKSLGAFGDAGMIVTNNAAINDKARMLRDYGRQGRYEHKIKGFNSRLDTVQAVILSAKLSYLDEWNGMRAANAAYYIEQIKGIDGVALIPGKEDRTHVYQTFAVRVQNRDDICEKMKARGVGVLIHYPIPVHLQEAYKDCGYKRGDFPVSETLADEVLSLPMFPHMTKDQIDEVCAVLKDVVHG